MFRHIGQRLLDHAEQCDLDRRTQRYLLPGDVDLRTDRGVLRPPFSELGEGVRQSCLPKLPGRELVQ